MDGLTDKLTELLNDPKGLDTIKTLAASIMGEGTDKSSDGGGELPSISPEQLGLLTRAMGMFSGGGDDDKTRLLMSLRPHLSPERQKKADNAIKILKLLRLLPLLNESGIFSMF